MAEKSKSDVLTYISSNLADNNAGLISAEDVRVSIFDTADSINRIVCSGDTDVAYPFYKDVRAKKVASVGGTFIAESGIIFPNAPANSSERQVQPFLGVENLQHNSLGGLTAGDPHTQYLNINGARPMTGNLRLGNNWIGEAGSGNQGIAFSGGSILTSGTLLFGDGSKISSGKGAAKAWINFDANGTGGTPVVRSSYNITSLDDVGVGKFRLTITSGVLGTGHFVAVANSNATSTSGSLEDFEVHSVGMVARSGVDPNKSVTFAIKNLAGQFVDAEINEVVIFGDNP